MKEVNNKLANMKSTEFNVDLCMKFKKTVIYK